jgi:hypothetical protein
MKITPPTDEFPENQSAESMEEPDTFASENAWRWGDVRNSS